MKEKPPKQEKKEDIKEGIKEDSKPNDLNEKVEELTNLLKRVQADFENYKKSVEKQRADFACCIRQDTIRKLLPVLDSIELALKNTNDKDKFVKGVELIFAQLYSVLQSEGLKPIESIGKKFDPYLHEVLLKEESDKEEDTILEELQKGYSLNGRIIRHSKVKVAKNDKKTNTSK